MPKVSKFCHFGGHFDTLGVRFRPSGDLDDLDQNWRNSGFFLFFGDFWCFVVKIELKRYTAEFGSFFVNFYEGFYFENREIIPPNSFFTGFGKFYFRG